LLATLCALLVPALATGSASAGERTRGFDIYNLTGQTLQIVELTTSGPQPIFETGPKQGDLLAPGEKIHMELIRGLVGSTNREVTIKYAGYPLPSDYRSRPVFWKMTLNSNYGYSQNCFTPSYSSGSVGQCDVSSDNVKMLDPPGTVHNITADNRQEQAAVLANLCKPGSGATCTYVPDGNKPEQTEAAPAVASSVHTNCSDKKEAEYEFSAEHKQSTENSVEAGFEYEFDSNFIFESAKVKLELKYGHKWVTEDSWGEKITRPIEPMDTAWIAITAPILRYNGDFHLDVGNTSWDLRNVYWDEPDASRHNLTHFYYKRRPANEKERQICEQNDVKGVLQSSRSQATITRIGTAGPNVLRGGPESNILSGRAGNDVLVSGGGSNRLSGGGGNDMLLGNSTDGKNVLNGGPGGDTIVDRGPALVRTGTRTGRGWDYVYVRDGHSDDTVICGSRRSIVYADKGDRVRGHCGRVIRRGPINRPRPLM
jgi:hypothetical protein